MIFHLVWQPLGMILSRASIDAIYVVSRHDFAVSHFAGNDQLFSLLLSVDIGRASSVQEVPFLAHSAGQYAVTDKAKTSSSISRRFHDHPDLPISADNSTSAPPTPHIVPSAHPHRSKQQEE